MDRRQRLKGISFAAGATLTAGDATPASAIRSL
jgi:hypothetical protein